MRKDFIAFLEQFVLPQRIQLLNKNLENRTRYLTVVLEDLYQQHNASAVIRTCDCFGIQDIHVIENRNKFQINKEITVGTQSWVNVIKHNKKEQNTTEALQELKSNGYRIVATSLHHNANTLENFNLSGGKSAIVFGTELDGISKEVTELTDEYLYIPMYGFAESFNISVSAAIIIHKLYNDLRKSTIDWQLSEEEKQELKIKWLKNSLNSPELLEKHYFEQLNQK